MRKSLKSSRTFGLCLLLITAVTWMSPSPAAALDATCKPAVINRLNIAIGLYRIELSSSLMVGQFQSAAKSPQRLKQLQSALKSLKDLNTNLQTRLGQLTISNDASGQCTQDKDALSNINTALREYGQTVQTRWVFLQNRLTLLKTLPKGQTLPSDIQETELWVNEPRTRYNVWRTIAQTTRNSSELSNALFVFGMLSRVEWHAAMALYSSLHPESTQIKPQQHLANAAKDTALLQKNWPQTSGPTNNKLWSSLNIMAHALPKDAPNTIPKAAPEQGWAAWIAQWIQGYSDVFNRNISKALTALEDIAN